MNPVNKQYGLLMPKKKQSTFKVSNVFGDDSDEETPKQEINSSLQRSSLQAKIKRQTQLEIDKALEADPTVYEYDSIYDDLQATKEEKDVAVKQKKDRKPKYITGLLKAAETRKREDEKRAERKVQKEREKEGGEFDDKEVFVTGAYRKKMQEMQELEEKERREAAMEELLDVKKQKDMSGFYRYMLNQQSGGATTEETNSKDVQVKEEPNSPKQSNSSGSGEINRSDISLRGSRDRGSSKERSRRRSSSHDRGRRRRDSSDDSGDRQERMRDKSESKDSRRKRKHSPESPRLSRRDTSESHRDRRRESSREKEHRRDKQRHRKGSDSGSEDLDRDRGNKSRSKEEEGYNKQKYSRKQGENTEKSPDRTTEAENKSNMSENKSEIKKSAVVSKKTTDSAASEARKRYLERKLAKEKVKLISQQE